MNIENSLLKWYYNNKRELPWRENTEPYQVWLSEIILQQTKISQGTSYYLKILKSCPNVHQMALCNEEEILKMWQGLGYYSRARNMHATAIHVSKNLNGVFPDNYNDLLKLRGVGNYTAAAIASICYNEVVPSVDGNVYRVISRLHSISEAIDSSKGQKVFQNLLKGEISKSHPGDFNQALMEFGATVCTPKTPLCESCIFPSQCTSFKNENIFSFPVKKSKTKVKDVFFYYFVFTFNTQVWIRKREDKDIWKMLHDFPSLHYNEEKSTITVLESKSFKQIIDSQWIEKISELNSFKHILSHRKINARFIHIELNSKVDIKHQNSFCIDKPKFTEYSVPKLIDKFWLSFYKPN